MAAVPARKPPTYQDVLDAPEGTVAEIVCGELHLSPRPSSRHAWSEENLSGDLRESFVRPKGGAPGGWWILREPELHLGHPDPRSSVLAPDLAGWRRERMPVVPDVVAFELAPDWVCEILSPGPAAVRRDRVMKPVEYAAAGVPYLWIVDPQDELLEVYRLHGSVYARIQAFSGDDVVRAEPFDAVALTLSAWWLRPAKE